MVGLSILAGGADISGAGKANGQESVRVFIGGIIPDEDMPRLKEMGITGIYGPGASTEDIIRDVREAVK